MKKIIKSIIIIFALVFLLTGCSSDDKYIKEIDIARADKEKEIMEV